TRDEFRAEVWLAIIHGARGIFYFAHSDCVAGPCTTPDGMTADLVDEMTIQNARISGIASVLQSPINPSTIGFAPGKSAVNLPLEATWRQSGGKSYLIVANASPNPLTAAPMVVSGLPAGTSALTVHGENRSVSLASGQFSDSFQPYAVHIYRN
ncbi:MAG TPA: hypothetical protein VFQ35_16750, partial [Polyangiaceae bacterium]|nr:hypothetical protein [Polyangiaceae bacterium]